MLAPRYQRGGEASTGWRGFFAMPRLYPNHTSDRQRPTTSRPTRIPRRHRDERGARSELHRGASFVRPARHSVLAVSPLRSDHIPGFIHTKFSFPLDLSALDLIIW